MKTKEPSVLLDVLRMEKARIDWFHRPGKRTDDEIAEDTRRRAEASALLDTVPEGGPGSP